MACCLSWSLTKVWVQNIYFELESKVGIATLISVCLTYGSIPGERGDPSRNYIISTLYFVNRRIYCVAFKGYYLSKTELIFTKHTVIDWSGLARFRKYRRLNGRHVSNTTTAPLILENWHLFHQYLWSVTFLT